MEYIQISILLEWKSGKLVPPPSHFSKPNQGASMRYATGDVYLF